MRKIPQAVAMLLLLGALSAAQSSAPTQSVAGGSTVQTQDQINSLLRDFLAHVSDPATHRRFWADSLIYVGSGGKVRTKQEILSSMAAESSSSKPDTTTYEAQDVQIRPFGNIALLNFTLVAHDDGKTDRYRNSGVFENINGQWQVISWQATKVADAPGPR